MSSFFGTITRGSNKVYVHITQRPPTGCRYSSRSETSLGVPMPAAIVESQADPPYVLVVPVLDATQYVSVTTVDRLGKVVLTHNTTITPTRAKLVSRANTLLCNKTSQVIRNCDQGDYAANKLRVVRILPDDATGEDVWHLMLAVRGASNQTPLLMRVLDDQGTSVVEGKAQLLQCKQLDRGEEFYYSLRLKRTVSPVVIWACDAQGETVAFGVLRHDEIDAHIGAWVTNTLPASLDPSYDAWFRAQRVSESELGCQRSTHYDIEPLFSFVVPLYHTPPEFFREMADSVRAQSYGRWELILVNASPHDKELDMLVGEYIRMDSRIRVINLGENLGISLNTNEGIKAAAGDYVSFLDHDDVLEPDLLYCYVKGINDYPSTDLLYCDEDKLLGARHVEPQFKPDWDPDMLRSFNYVIHLLTVRMCIARELMPKTDECDGAQDYRMALLAGSRSRNVYHARRVLYHWRISETSTAGGFAAKPHTSEAGLLALQEHLYDIQLLGLARADPAPNAYWIDYESGREMPTFSVVIVAQGDEERTEKMLRHLFEDAGNSTCEVVVASEWLAEFDVAAIPGSVKLLACTVSPGSSYAQYVNASASVTSGDCLVIVEASAEPSSSDWLRRFVYDIQRVDVGVVGGKVRYADGTLHSAGYALSDDGVVPLGRYLFAPDEWHGYPYNCTQRISAVDTACFAVRRDVWERLGGMNEMMCAPEEALADFCLRSSAAGFAVCYDPRASFVTHALPAAWSMSPDECVRMSSMAVEVAQAGDSRGDRHMNPQFAQDARGIGYRRLSAIREEAS